MSNELSYMSATEMGRLIRARELSPVDVVDHCLARIDERNDKINAFVLVLHEQARQRARAAEQAVMNGQDLGPLHGIPVAIKDLFDFKAGVRNTFGCRPFADFVPDQSCTYVQRLEQAGAIVVGKTNTPEMGHKGITDNYLFGPTSTPFDLSMNAGGSSGGSAAALAAGLVPLAQGSDAGGSIRIPASMCSVYGLKASYGKVASASRPDAFLSHTPFIHAGPLARTVQDAALMLSVMAGPDPRDPFSVPDDGSDYVGATQRDISGLRIAYSPDFDIFPVEDQVAAVVRDAARAFETAGAPVSEVKIGLKRSQQELAAVWIRQMSVLYAELAELFKPAGIDLAGRHRDDLSPQLADMIAQGGRLSALQYKMDDVVRTEVLDAVQDVLDEYDLLVTPTLSVAAVANATDGNTLGPTEVNGQTVDPCIGWCLTYPLNYSGHPAASIPAGFTDAGLPVGLQIIGRRYADDTVLAASAAFERVRPWHDAYLKLERE